jgi:A/G-specific adenine glycosylase
MRAEIAGLRDLPLMPGCEGRRAGIAADLPAKTPKKAKPVRQGIAYLVRRKDGAFLLETRPPSGLLGGMLGWPGIDWVEGDPPPAPPVAPTWHDPGLEVRHTFTHFHLRLSLRLAVVDAMRIRNAANSSPSTNFAPVTCPR